GRATVGASATTLGDDVPESGTYQATTQTAIGTSEAPPTTTGHTQALSAHRAERLEGRIARATIRSNRLRFRRVGIPSIKCGRCVGPSGRKCFYWVPPRSTPA